jgi:hypothetical protein
MFVRRGKFSSIFRIIPSRRFRVVTELNKKILFTYIILLENMLKLNKMMMNYFCLSGKKKHG